MKEIREILESVGDENLKLKLIKLYEEIEPKLLKLPASIRFHHFWPGGLFQHFKEVMNLALFFFEHLEVEDTKRDDVILISFIHDLNKLNKYVYNKNFLSREMTPSESEFSYNYKKIDMNPTAEAVKIAFDFDIKLNDLQLNALTFSHGGWSRDQGRMTRLAGIIHLADLWSVICYGYRQEIG